MEEDIILEIFSQRFSNLINENNIDISFLLKQLGIKSKSTIYRYMNAEMAPKVTTVKILADIFNVNPNWLMGHDVPRENSLKQIASSASAVVFVYGTIPAGIPMECIEDVIDTEEIPSNMLRGGKQYFGLKVKGDSMYPEYLDGDTLILLKQDDCESGDDAVVMVNGNDGTFKRVFKNENGIILQPLNNNYQPIVYTNEQIENLPIKIIGIVDEIRRKKKRK